ncbi:hypothetical protein U1Q18_027363 [Sarracenia purpurea var. burkii]
MGREISAVLPCQVKELRLLAAGEDMHVRVFIAEEAALPVHWLVVATVIQKKGSGFYHDPTAGWYYSTRDSLYYKFEDGNYALLGSDQCGNSSHTSVQDDPSTHELSHKDVDHPLSQGGESEAFDLQAVADESPTGAGNYDTHELEDGEWIPDEDHGVNDSSGSVSDEGTSWNEENWCAQYGQVIRSGEESLPDFQAVDLWDWAMVHETRKDGKNQVVRLVGRLVRQSARLHPSMPLGGGLLKTAPICEVHLDLVRVTSGQVYKLRTPSARYLVSLSTYDSSNPTKDWGFPELSINRKFQALPASGGNWEAKMVKGMPVQQNLPSVPGQIGASKNLGGSAYRDRAAERRALHGGFGVGPGQKKPADSNACVPLSPVSHAEAAGEVLKSSFGAGSYARRILESMGWKEGEALGSSSKGLIEPLRVVGNKGNTGLGWESKQKKPCLNPEWGVGNT